MVAWIWPGDRFPPSHPPLFIPLTSICWERPKLKGACRLKQHLRSFCPSSQAHLHFFIPNFSTFFLFQVVQEAEEWWDHSQSVKQFLSAAPSVFSSPVWVCPWIAVLQWKPAPAMGPPWTTNHLWNIHMLQCKVLHAEWMYSSHGLQNNTFSIIHRGFSALFLLLFRLGCICQQTGKDCQSYYISWYSCSLNIVCRTLCL